MVDLGALDDQSKGEAQTLPLSRHGDQFYGRFVRNVAFFANSVIYLPVYSLFFGKVSENAFPKEIKKSQRRGHDFEQIIANLHLFQEYSMFFKNLRNAHV